jgi:hypothetical protein
MREFLTPKQVVRTLVIVVSLGTASAAAPDKTPLLYDRDIRPILSEKCFLCHGQDSKKRMAGLRLDSSEGAIADRGGHAALVPGKPEASLMFQRITAPDPARRMPPVSSNRTLTADQISLLKRWIEEGGNYSKHWAFIPPARPPVPQVADRNWVKQPIDAFVYQRLAAEHLRPSPAASPSTWLRRVSLDLVGLPPSPTEFDAFAKDVAARGESAYSAAVDRLLASPRYGERMAIDWLDVARYADTHGFNNDSSRTMWRWRDWVIQSFNNNLPYDRFITAQLAGDLLPNPTLDQRIATGFLRNHVINSEGGIIDEEYRVEYVADRVSTVGVAWLGLTLGCAHCHDHKFDPITQRDHYRFFAFFNNVPEMGEDGRVANAVPMIPAPTHEQQEKLQQLESAISSLTQQIESREKAWTWRDEDAQKALRSASQASIPDGAVVQIHDTRGADPKPQIPGKGVPVAKRQPLTFSFWLQPQPSDTDAALLSTIDYAISTAAVTYGKGIELRLVGGELEFRYADRFPAYSIRVRSEGAHILSGERRYLTLLFEGARNEAMHTEASSVRMFADGRELPIRVFNDDLSLPDEEKPTMTRFRIGWDTGPKSARYTGEFGDLAIWTRAFTPAEIAGTFEQQAIPYAVASAHDSRYLREAMLKASDPVFAQDMRKLDSLRANWLALRRSIPSSMVMEEMAKPRETHLLIRGGYDAPGEKVEAGVPQELLGAWPQIGSQPAPRNRLGLAQWLTKADHPLTARVVVNRFWQQLFGQGIVKTSDNFGMQGDWPSHPELLDWLAREFVDSGWNVKALMKRLVLSATYRQDSSASPELIARDPENRLLARGPRFRLPAEIIRDQALAISGLLTNRLGGPSVFPYQPEGLYKGIVVAASYPGTRYIESRGDDLYRRSLYTFWKRTVPHPTMIVFDAPDREFCVVRRAATNTPLQALTLLNDPIFVEAARKLAERSIHEGGPAPDGRLALAFRLATGRAPDSDEKSILRHKLDEMLKVYQSDLAGAAKLLSVGASAHDPQIPVSELAAYTAIANIILNLDEVITKG